VDHVGGLVLVRLMSCGFMLAATGLLYLTSRRLYGHWPAVIAIGLFASLGISQDLGVLATYDAMALMLIAFAAFCAVKAATSARWLLMVPAVLLLANAAKYASTIFDPVVIWLAALVLQPEGWRRVCQRAGALACVSASLSVIAVALAGTAYLQGLMFTTIARKTSSGTILSLEPASTHAIISFSWGLMGLIICLGALAVITATVFSSERSSAWLLTILVVAGLLVTLEAIHLHDLTSVSKHDDFGAWFTAIPAGYAFARGAELVRAWYKRTGYVILAAASVLVALHVYVSHPTSANSDSYNVSVINSVAPYLHAPAGSRYLLSNEYCEATPYNLHLALPWQFCTDDDYIKYPVPGRGGDGSGTVPGLTCLAPKPRCVYLEGPAGFVAAIHAHWFAVVSLAGRPNRLPIDAVELGAVRSTPGYELASMVGGPTYIYAPDYPRRLGGTAR